jgi:hypothetical protein
MSHVETQKMKDAHARRMGWPETAAGPLNGLGVTKSEFEKARAMTEPLPDAISHAIELAGGKMSAENVRALIVQQCRELETMLLEKNEAYGNSALDPVRLFSHASPIEQLKVRIDDKISRIARGDFAKVKEEDLKVVTKDILGYLILIQVGWRLGLE